MKLYPFQKKDVKRALKERSGGALNASIMGAGKTVIGVEVMHRAGFNQVLIVAPINTLSGWAETLREQTGEHLRRVGNYDELSRLALMAVRAGKPGWFFAGWEWMANQARLRDFAKIEGVIFDEIHRASTRETNTQRMAYNIGRIVDRNGGGRLGLSATPFGNKVAGAWGVMRALWPDTTDGSFWRWADEYLEVKEVDISSHNDDAPKLIKKIGGELTPGAIVKSMPLYWRHEANTKCCKQHPKGVQADLPKRVIHRVGVSITPTQRRMYKELEKIWMTLPPDADEVITTDGYKMVLDLRMHQVTLATPTTEMIQIWKKDKETGERELVDWTKVKYPEDTTSTKLDAMMDILADIPEGERVVIFTHSRAILDAVLYRINKKFGRGYGAVWHGGVPKGAREQIKKRFMDPEGKLRIIAAQTRSISEGVDGLQKVCWNEIWLSQLTDRVHNQQAMGRLMRGGQKMPVQSWQIYADDTLELEQYASQELATQMMNESLSGGGC